MLKYCILKHCIRSHAHWRRQSTLKHCTMLKYSSWTLCTLSWLKYSSWTLKFWTLRYSWAAVKCKVGMMARGKACSYFGPLPVSPSFSFSSEISEITSLNLPVSPLSSFYETSEITAWSASLGLFPFHIYLHQLLILIDR